MNDTVLERNKSFYTKVVLGMQQELNFSDILVTRCKQYPDFIEINTGAYRFNVYMESTVHAPFMQKLSLKYVQRLREMLRMEWRDIEAEVVAVRFY